MRQTAHFGLLVCVLFAVGGVVDAFSGHVSLRAETPRRAAAGAVCALSREHQRAEECTDPTPFTQLSRRSVLAVSLASVIGGQCTVAAADDADDVETGNPAEVVVKGEMRLEVGADQKLKKAGGKARAEVVLRCVGKGIISKTTEEINLDDFPPAGRPGAEGESGGVPFIVTVGDLVATTEKGRVVNRELWGDDDIFVAIDVYPVDSKKRVLRGIGKAKYKDGVHQQPLVLLE